MTTKVDQMTFDFARAYQRHPDRALSGLYLLLLDAKACRERIAFLESVGARGAEETSPPTRPRPKEDFRQELTLLGTAGLFPAHRAGTLDPERLHRLTCDPEALWEAHRRLVGDLEEEPSQTVAQLSNESQTGVRTDTSVESFTDLLREGQTTLLLDRLGPWLPFLFRRVGLSEGLTVAFLVFLRNLLAKVPEPKDRFRDLLPGWLETFAKEQNEGDRFSLLSVEEIDPRFVGRGSLEIVLARAGEHEADWQRAFRESALNAPLHSPQDLMDYAPAAIAQEPGLVNYRLHLFFAAQERENEGRVLFEVGP